MNRFVLLLLVVSTTSLADDPFACVDPEFTDAFLRGWSTGPITYSTSIPDNFPDLSVPDRFTLVGSRVAASSSSVVYKTDVGAQAALASAISTMTDAGWTKKEEHRMSSGGFQTTVMPKRALLCRDQNDNTRALMAMAHSGPGQSYVSFQLHSQAQLQSCSESAALSSLRMQYESLNGHIPTLMLPEDAKSSNNHGGSSGDEANSRVDVLTSMSREGLLSFLGDQIQDQNWAFDTNWSGELSAGSSWTLDTPDDGKLIGTLQILGPSVGAVRVRFSVFPAEPKIGGPQSNMTIMRP